MNAKEMEKAILTLQAGMEAAVNPDHLRIELKNLHSTLMELSTRVEQAEQVIAQRALEAATAAEGTRAMIESIVARIEEISAKVEGRNKSAPVKRNMTDADALAALNGPYKDMGHKETAEALGLTYAQVYSCRLGFTFKHVIRELEKAGWTCKWAKG